MTVDYEVEAGVGLVRFNRPDVLNAFDEEMGNAALDTVTRAAADSSVRCIVLSGAGRAFSAGEDLGALAEGYAAGRAPDHGAILERRYNPLIRALRSAPKPVVAAVNGVTAGSGTSIALACDFRLASERARLVFAFIKVGLVPDSAGLWFLTRAVGAAKAFELAALGETIDAHEALRLGLVNRVVAEDDFETGWKEFATALAAGPTIGYARTKELANLAGTRTLDEELDAEIGVQAAAGATEDHLEGMHAFLEKRPPRFRGR